MKRKQKHKTNEIFTILDTFLNNLVVKNTATLLQ